MKLHLVCAMAGLAVVLSQTVASAAFIDITRPDDPVELSPGAEQQLDPREVAGEEHDSPCAQRFVRSSADGQGDGGFAHRQRVIGSITHEQRRGPRFLERPHTADLFVNV